MRSEASNFRVNYGGCQVSNAKTRSECIAELRSMIQRGDQYVSSACIEFRSPSGLGDWIPVITYADVRDDKVR